jgi:hypothetical protein
MQKTRIIRALPASKLASKRRAGTALWRQLLRQGFTTYLLPSGCKLFILHKAVPERADQTLLQERG